MSAHQAPLLASASKVVGVVVLASACSSSLPPIPDDVVEWPREASPETDPVDFRMTPPDLTVVGSMDRLNAVVYVSAELGEAADALVRERVRIVEWPELVPVEATIWPGHAGGGELGFEVFPRSRTAERWYAVEIADLGEAVTVQRSSLAAIPGGGNASRVFAGWEAFLTALEARREGDGVAFRAVLTQLVNDPRTPTALLHVEPARSCSAGTVVEARDYVEVVCEGFSLPYVYVGLQPDVETSTGVVVTPGGTAPPRVLVPLPSDDSTVRLHPPY